MGNETKGHGLIGTVTHSGGSVAVVLTVQGQQTYTKMTIKGQGKTGPSVKAIVGRESACSLAFVGQDHIAGGTKGDLIVSMIRADGATIDQYKWKTMKAFDATYAAESGTGGHDSWNQSFEVEDDMDTDNFVYTPAN